MDDTADIPPTQYRALSELRYQIRKFLHFSDMAAQAAGLEPRQHQLLLAVKGFTGDQDGPTIGYLAERLRIRHHSAVELVDRMATRGMVGRRVSERDHRRVIVGLTATSESLLKNLSAHHISEIRQMAPALVAALREVLTKELNARAGGVEDT